MLLALLRTPNRMHKQTEVQCRGFGVVESVRQEELASLNVVDSDSASSALHPASAVLQEKVVFGTCKVCRLWNRRETLDLFPLQREHALQDPNTLRGSPNTVDRAPL